MKTIAAQQNGFILLLSVIIIGAIGATLALYLFLTGALSGRASLDLTGALETRYLADGCAEQALLTAEDCSTQTITTTTPQGSCTYTITPNGGSRTIQVTATSQNFTKRLALTVNFSTSSTTSSTVSWQEVTHF